MVTVVSELAQTPIGDVRPLATLREAAAELGERGVGALVVRDHRGVLGILTEFDVARALAERVDPDDERVRPHMTRGVVTISAGATVAEAAASMARHEIRHLVVVDDDGGPLGVVSSRDLLTALGEPASLGAS